MAKLIEYCGDCSLSKVVDNKCVCRYEGIYREIVAPNSNFPDWCPRKDAIPAPAPYSASNTPQMGDVVRTPDDMGMVTSRALVDDPDVFEYHAYQRHRAGKWFRPEQLTLLYRPEPTA